MGSVAVLRTSGDNDRPIFPVRYHVRHLYCDQCGSLELQSWIEADDRERLAAMRRRLKRLIVVRAAPALFDLPETE